MESPGKITEQQKQEHLRFLKLKKPELYKWAKDVETQLKLFLASLNSIEYETVFSNKHKNSSRLVFEKSLIFTVISLIQNSQNCLNKVDTLKLYDLAIIFEMSYISYSGNLVNRFSDKYDSFKESNSEVWLRFETVFESLRVNYPQREKISNAENFKNGTSYEISEKELGFWLDKFIDKGVYSKIELVKIMAEILSGKDVCHSTEILEFEKFCKYIVFWEFRLYLKQYFIESDINFYDNLYKYQLVEDDFKVADIWWEGIKKAYLFKVLQNTKL